MKSGVFIKCLLLVSLLAIASGCAGTKQARVDKQYKPLFAANQTYSPDDVLCQDAYGRVYFAEASH